MADRSLVTRRSRRTAAGLLIAALTGLLAVLLPASPAAAHAVLQSASPAQGEVLTESPTQVRLQFSEPVTISVGYAKVASTDGDTVSGAPEQSDGGAVLTLSLPADLPDGGYIVSYRLVSADSHPISGAIAFAVGNADVPDIDSAGTVIGSADTDPVVSAAYAVTRWAGYLGLAALGGAVLLGALAPSLRTARSTGRLGWTGFDVVLGATLLAGLLQGPYAAGRGLGSVFDPALLAASVATNLGRMLAVRLILLGIIGVLLWEWRAAERTARWQLPAAAALLAGVAATYAAAGHAIAGPLPALSVPVEWAHLAAVVGWLGGLAAVLLILRAADDAQPAVRRYSRIALISVVVIVLTGVAQAMLRVGGPAAMVGTTYGRVLIAKVALVLVVIGAAYASRKLVGRRILDPTRLRRSVLAEAVIAAGIVAFAAVLVATPPARDVYAVAEDATLRFDNGYTAQLSIDPGRTGSNDVHLYVFSGAGALTDVESATIVAENLPAQAGPIEIELIRVGTGHFLITGQQLPAAGTWTIEVTLRLGEVSRLDATTTVEVR